MSNMSRSELKNKINRQQKILKVVILVFIMITFLAGVFIYNSLNEVQRYFETSQVSFIQNIEAKTDTEILLKNRGLIMANHIVQTSKSLGIILSGLVVFVGMHSALMLYLLRKNNSKLLELLESKE